MASGKNWVDIKFKDVKEDDIEKVTFNSGTLLSLVAYGLQDVPIEFNADYMKDLLTGYKKITYAINKFVK